MKGSEASRPPLMADAKCREHPELKWVPIQSRVSPKQLVEMRTICMSCSHRAECREHAITHDEHGMWGGTTEVERERLKSEGRLPADA